MKKINSSLVALLLLVGITISCNKVLEIDPRDSIDQELAVTDRFGVNASIASIYAALKTENLYGNRLIGLAAALADDGRATNRSGRYNNEYRNLRGSHYSHWTDAYIALNRINIVLEAITVIQDPSITPAMVNAWVGELKFLRALYHFDLVKAYAYIPGAIIESINRGGVPLLTEAITTSTGALNAQTPRLAQQEVYAQIYADLEEAIEKLADLAPTGGAPAVIGKANKQAAQLLFSRVALYNKDYLKVIEFVNPVVASRGGTLLTVSNYMQGFTAAINPESVFEVIYQQVNENLGVNVSLQTLYSSLSQRMPDARRDSTDNYPGRTAIGLKTERGGFGDLIPTDDLLRQLGITFANNGSNTAIITTRSSDVRNMMFEVGASFRGNPFIECTKYLGKNGDLNWDNVSVLRISEAYLNRAEAYAEVGSQQNLALALADLNTIRINRGLSALNDLNQQELIDAILLQRRLEFAFEGGHRFLDLKRRGQNINKPFTNTTFSFDDVLLLPGIPQGDVDGSQGLIPQNSGY